MKKIIILLSITFIGLIACKGKSNSSTSTTDTKENQQQDPPVINKNALIGYWVIPEGEDKMKYPALSIDPMGTMTTYNLETSFDHWQLIEPNILMMLSKKGDNQNFDVISVDAEKLVLKDEKGKTITYQMDFPPEGRE